MKRISLALCCLYGLAIAADIAFIIDSYENARWFSKPLLMLILIILYASETGISSVFSKIWLTALLFSWCGDVFLMIHGFFVQGLLAFLAAHFSYIIYIVRTNPQQKGPKKIKPLVVLFIVVYWFLCLALLLPHVGNLKIPVTIYTTTICIFWILAVNLYQKVDVTVAGLFISGASLFVISDTVLAVNSFVFPQALLPIIVMLTYTIAQFLLTLGSIRHLKNT
ncbi:MAG: lysoplasmalogenase [Chitinophagaceae bacterium]|nr:lysoplasmalogenase [Chitinophagaceae bacterium]